MPLENKKEEEEETEAGARRQEGENDRWKRGGRSVIAHLRITVPP